VVKKGGEKRGRETKREKKKIRVRLRSKIKKLTDLCEEGRSWIVLGQILALRIEGKGGKEGGRRERSQTTDDDSHYIYTMDRTICSRNTP